MTWSISHGGTKCVYSYSGVAALASKLEKADPARWPALSPVLDRESGDPFAVSPEDAGEVCIALTIAASRFRFRDRKWAAMARQIADSALRAATAHEPWRWS